MARGSNGSAAAERGQVKVSRSRGRRGGSVRRFLGLLALLPLAGRAPLYARLLWALALDERIPASRKAVLVAGIGYAFLGRDLIPDDVPVFGGLDDLVVLAIATDVFLDGVDEVVLTERLFDLGIPRSAYDEDVARIRSILPGPVRRTFHRLPQVIDVAAEAIQNAGVGPRLRSWIQREGSPA
jgi:uncharacterized membrane protein YkvA (DUF1232 family)